MAEIKAIDQIYFGQHQTSLPKTLNKLVEKGFIVSYKEIIGKDCLSIDFFINPSGGMVYTIDLKSIRESDMSSNLISGIL